MVSYSTSSSGSSRANISHGGATTRQGDYNNSLWKSGEKEKGGWRIEAVRKRKMDVETIFTTFDESEGARRASLPPRHIAEANVI